MLRKRIALQRIRNMFELAKKTLREEPELAQHYAELARRIAMKMNVRIPREYRKFICKHCKKFILPGVNCRVRTQRRREPHVVITCLLCDGKMRIPLRARAFSHLPIPNRTIKATSQAHRSSPSVLSGIGR